MSSDWLGELCERAGWTPDDFGRVVRSACRGLEPTDADDIHQEVARALGTAFKAGIPAGLRTREDVHSYVFTVARNMRGKFLKKRANQSRRLTHVNPLDLTGGTKKPSYDSGPQTAAAVLMELTDDQRERILALLPDDWRRLRAFFRLHLAGMDGQDIARELGPSPATVSRRLADCEEYLDADSLAEILGANAPERRIPDGGA